MVKIGDIYLGGAEGSSDKRIFNSGISFFLAADSEISNILSFENGIWEVELKEGQQSIIARCTDVLSENQILESGFKYCQQAIDFLSIEYAETLSTQEIGNFHFLLYKKDDKFILKQVQTAFSTITSHVKVDVIDTITGNIVPQAPPPEPKWAPAVRFYRLAQNANDLYEAYRNAYLSFEYLLDEIYSNKTYKKYMRKLKQNYREQQWLIDALKDADSKYQLIDYIPKGKTNTIEEFVENQYVETRCKLFHAKGDKCSLNIIIPADSFNPIELSDAYEKLMILLKHSLKKHYNIGFGETVWTYSGFKLMMEENLSNGCLLIINDDDSPINGNLIERYMFPFTEDQLEKDKQLDHMRSRVSPKKFMENPSELGGLASELQYDINDSGIAKIFGEFDENELCKIHLIHRTSLLYQRVMFGFLGLTIFYNKDGLHLSGIDKFEINIYIKLKNKGDPQK